MSRRLLLMLLFTLFGIVSIATLAAGPLKAESIPSVMLPAGYRMEQVAVDLTFPMSIAWDNTGRMYVLEAGSANGPKEVGAGRVLRIDSGAKTVVLDGLSAPASDVKFIGGEMYVAHRGTLSVVRGDARLDLISGLPWGDYSTGEVAFDSEGWIYLGNGAATNSGVVGYDSFLYGWASENPGLRDVPAKDIALNGVSFTSLDLRTANPVDTAVTGAFEPFGASTSPGHVVRASPKANGCILRVRPDGSGLEAFAWGLRNPFALRFSPDGRLIAVDQGYDDRGARPVANAPDPIYVVEQGGWFGWPDYVAGVPITDPSFASPGSAGGPLSFLMRDHPAVVQPLTKLEPHTGAMKFDFAPTDFDGLNRIFIATFGETDPLTGPLTRPTGSRILAFDPETGKLEAFAYNRALAPAGRNLMGLNHPIDVKFGPDGCMYVVDYGVYEVNGQTANAVPQTGVIWKISKQRSEYKQFSFDSQRSMASIFGGVPWTPDYAALQRKLADYTGNLGAEWGIFFKDLASGRTFGVNQGIQVPAASCVKVPVVLYASKLASQGNLDWNERLEYIADRDWQGGAGSLQYMAKDGDTFSIRELAEKAIRESDNVAWKMLERRLRRSNIAAFMRSLGGKVVYPGGQNVSTPEDLALYMESALSFSKVSHEGDKLLYDLAHTIWNTGLNRYITEVPVAHKEGDLSGVSNDVGLVYAEHPYILAIMSKGQGDIELGFEHIGEISRMVYDYQTAAATGAGAVP